MKSHMTKMAIVLILCLKSEKESIMRDKRKNREYYKEAATKRGYSLNQFALTAMDEKIEREPVEED